METYVISEIDCFSGRPIIKIHYAGLDRNKAIEIFRKNFDYLKIPSDIENEIGNDAVEYIFNELDKTGKFVIDDEWIDDYDGYPPYIQLLKKEFK